MAWRAICVGVTSMLLLGLSCWSYTTGAENSRFAMTHSRSQYVHWIDLYDADGSRIDPTAPDAAPYSPVHTCGRCHDYEAMSHGHHFNAMSKLTDKGRPGEPWIWTDERTGTQIPLSYRNWPGTYDPRELGITPWDMVLKFGRQMPGGGPGMAAPAKESTTDVSARDAEQADAGDAAPGDAATGDAAPGDAAPADPPDNGRWQLSGQLAIDCMMCHSKDSSYSPEKWWGQVTKQNFAWAPSAALGLADIDGDVSKLDDPEPATESDGDDAASEDDAGEEVAEGPRLPKTTYRPVRMDADKKIFFNVIRKPSNNVCYYCHTTRSASPETAPDWMHDQDVHLRAGMSCTDCHRNGVEHHTVRGFEGEQHPSERSVTTLTCRGCHMDEHTADATVPGGRMGAPKPLHKGLPPLHLERLSCTACHSGPLPSEEALQVQTAMAHGLGLPTHHLSASTQPQMVAPVMLRTDGEVLYPHRMVWPAFWGVSKGDVVTPLNPDLIQDTLRKKLRVRRKPFTETLGEVKLKTADKVAVLGEEGASKSAEELTEEEKAKLEELERTMSEAGFREKLGVALAELQSTLEDEGTTAVYVAGGRGYRLGDGETVELFETDSAKPYAWKLAHDVRPARWSTGTTGCFDCHDHEDSAIFNGQVTALGPAVDLHPPTQKMAEMAGYDRFQIDTWNLSFQGRKAFKWFGFLSASVVALVLLSFVLLGVNGVFGLFRRS